MSKGQGQGGQGGQGQDQSTQGQSSQQGQGQSQQGQQNQSQQKQGQQGNQMQEEHVVSATDISHSLRGINFPANLEDLVQRASNNNAPSNVTSLLQSFPNQQFNSMADVEHAFHRVKAQ